MESEFLREPWVFPRTKANSSTREEVTAAFSAWEEDFQDLSSWCMDTFQGQCDFHVGTLLLDCVPGTKYEDNGVSTVEEEGILKDLKSTTDDEKLNLKMNTVKTKTTEESSDNRHLLLSPSELVNDCGLGYNNEEKNGTSSWLMSPESIASTSTASSKQHNADADALFQPEHRASGDLARPTSPFDTTTNQRETWDELRRNAFAGRRHFHRFLDHVETQVARDGVVTVILAYSHEGEDGGDQRTDSINASEDINTCNVDGDFIIGGASRSVSQIGEDEDEYQDR
ncbi:putative serine-rich isoform x2 [Lasius niger]|uniref:Putative serine-rich isoform x2 n=1 Tax=Lasius niger TaxID=67767 RepID=A0A0J7L3A6_LASNI|nr:putative serine-rich isoform x2 [Lasius niger]